MMRTPTWQEALRRYASLRVLQTRVQRRSFSVVAVAPNLIVTPASTGRSRPINQAEFERAVPLIGRAGREIQTATFNSSYIEAIVDDLTSNT